MKNISTATAAVLTATALTAGVVAPVASAAVTSPAVVEQRQADVELAALRDTLTEFFDRLGIELFPNQSATGTSAGFSDMPLAIGPLLGKAPDPGDIPDLTLGVGQLLAGAFGSVGTAAADVVPGTVNLDPLWNALGRDPTQTISNALDNVLAAITKAMPAELNPLFQAFLDAAGITTMADLLKLIGLTLSPIGDEPGLNLVTSGVPFGLLRAIGVDLGWSPMFPAPIADQVVDTDPQEINPVATLSTLRDMIPSRGAANLALRASLLAAMGTLSALGLNHDIDVAVPVVVGFGLGAFAAGEAYPQILDSLDSGLTVPVMVLLRNPGRANGGLFARFYPLAALAGLNTVTRDTAVTGSVDTGGVMPIKIDLTAQYDPLSDFGSWPNPFTLANSAAAALFPTYIIRGADLDTLRDDLQKQLGIDPETDPDDISLLELATNNPYVTLPSSSLPLFEPVRLPVDAANLLLRPLTGVSLNNPIATALEPAAKILVNLGYTDVDQSSPTYDRTLNRANELTPYGTLPANVDWLKVPGDVVKALGTGIEDSFEAGIITKSTSSPAGMWMLEGPTGKSKLTSELRQAGKSLEDGVNKALKATGLKPGKNSLVSKAAKEIRDTGRDLRGKAKEAVEKVAAQVKNTVQKAKANVKNNLN